MGMAVMLCIILHKSFFSAVLVWKCGWGFSHVKTGISEAAVVCHIAKMRFSDNGKDTGNDLGPDNQRKRENIAVRNSRGPGNNYNEYIKLDVCITIYLIEGKCVLQHHCLPLFF